MAKYKYKFLVIDDDESYIEDSLNIYAQDKRIKLLYASNLEDGIEIFKDGYGFHGVILDVICLKTRDQEIPDNSFITAALTYFNNKANALPVVALTGEPDETEVGRLKGLFQGTMEVFTKANDEEKLLAFLKQEADKLPQVKLRKQYKNIFDIVEKCLGSDAEKELEQCLSDLSHTELPKIKGSLVNIRSLLEKIFIALNAVDNTMVLDEHIKPYGKLDVKVRPIFGHIKGNFDPRTQTNTTDVYVDHQSSTFKTMDFCYSICSNGVHAIDQNEPFKPTKHTVTSTLHALMDTILWFDREYSNRAPVK